MSPAADAESERLREALLDLERTRARQKEALDVAEQILRCLRVFDAEERGASGEPLRILHDLMAELRPMLGFEDAFFLAPDADESAPPGPGEARVARVTAATSPRFEGTRWTLGALFGRAARGTPVSVFDVDFVDEWKAQPDDVRRGVKSALHVGLRGGASAAFLVCTHSQVGFFGDRPRRLAGQLAPLASQALERMEHAFELSRVNQALVREMAEREHAQEALAQAQRDLVATARRAGMAEVAINMLHNVGNVLNSIVTSSTAARDEAARLPVDHLRRAADLLAGQAGKLVGDRRAEKLPEFFARLSTEATRGRDAIVTELVSLRAKLDHVAAIVDLQQQLARGASLVEEVRPAAIIEDALQINAAGLTRHVITIERDLAPVPALPLDRHGLLQILVNLVSNAKYALDGAPSPRVLRIRMRLDHDTLIIEVEDTGKGILPEDLPRIFQHGFTTREGGHGFGLHSGALAIQRMGGSIRVHSDGAGRGARFTVEVPVRAPAEKG
ncbi:MAG: ATP-binding protein [Polyangiaceae bacterium]